MAHGKLGKNGAGGDLVGDPAFVKLDDLTMVFDLMSRLLEADEEEHAVKQMSEIFFLLFAPGRLAYQSVAEQKFPLNLSGKALSQGYYRLESGRGFVALVRHGGDLFGVLEADDLAFPAYLDRYLNLVPMVAQACGLAVANARTTQARLRAEDSSRQQQERFRLAFDTSPDAININRLEDGLYVQINQGFTALTGFTADDVKGRTSSDINIWADLADRQTLVRGLLEKGYYENLEAKFRKKDGSLTTALMSARVITLEGVPHIISITRDISEQRRMEVELRQSQKMEALGTLAGGIAHDFNNILAAIMGYTEIALDDSCRGNVNPGDLRQILAATHRAKELVQQILSFSRKRAPELRPIDLNKVLVQVNDVLTRTLPKMVSIVINPAPDLATVQADHTQLEQVLLNLASNAADAMPDGGVLAIETRMVDIGEDICRQHMEVRPGRYTLLTVSDTGVGIDNKTLEHIFEPFFTTKKLGKGTGLGLSSAYGIIKNHGGHIYCYSELGMGTTFNVYLPVSKKDIKAAGSELDRPHRDQALNGDETILVVDDEEALRTLGQRILSAQGYRVIAASSGEEAVEIFKRQGEQLNLVVMDLGMPGIGGHQALKAILTLNPMAKIIIASGYSAHGRAKGALEDGAVGYVGKPFNRLELLATVRNILDSK